MEHLSLHMEHQNQKQEQKIQWRRDKVQELASKGHSQREISHILQVGLGTINRDIIYLRQQAKQNVEKYVNEKLPEEFEKCLTGLNAILKQAWIISEKAGSTSFDNNKKQQIQALALAKECYVLKLDLLTNASVVEHAVKFIEQKKSELLTTTTKAKQSPIAASTVAASTTADTTIVAKEEAIAAADHNNPTADFTSDNNETAVEEQQQEEQDGEEEITLAKTKNQVF